MTSNPIIFDRKCVRMHRDRAVRLCGDDFFLKEMVLRGQERLAELNQSFDVALELGAYGGTFGRMLGDSDKIGTLLQADLSEAMMRSARKECEEGNMVSRPCEPSASEAVPHVSVAGAQQGHYIVADEEFLPIAEGSIDLCISFGSLQWVNDLPGSLIQINHAIKPGGLFLAIVPGGKTLIELRDSFERAEMEISGGVSPRISPFLDAKDAANLLQRAGFSDPVVDSETLTLEYDHPLKLSKELRAMGQSNALIHSRKHFTPVSLMMLMADMYMQKYMNADGRIPATMELVTLTAWKSG